MSSVTPPPSVAPAPPSNVPPRSIPSLDELREWTSEPDHRVVIPDVDWGYYEQLVDSIPEGANLHVDYDGKDLEIMSLSPIHRTPVTIDHSDSPPSPATGRRPNRSSTYALDAGPTML